ncbi:hypothetical protein F5148DRAFT_41692 [Russula earlei]|uniref:Uncharacterized protein n=1 Tax=Russula earlei TaxID=71964 RepID=A0ACC0UA42_9AGAM|nr:hypothetical protein F5148DRAFT_41692 [Russula earlei]
MPISIYGLLVGSHGGVGCSVPAPHHTELRHTLSPLPEHEIRGRLAPFVPDDDDKAWPPPCVTRSRCCSLGPPRGMGMVAATAAPSRVTFVSSRGVAARDPFPFPFLSCDALMRRRKHAVVFLSDVFRVEPLRRGFYLILFYFSLVGSLAPTFGGRTNRRLMEGFTWERSMPVQYESRAATVVRRSILL